MACLLIAAGRGAARVPDQDRPAFNNYDAFSSFSRPPQDFALIPPP
jgi:hypothetical protein